MQPLETTKHILIWIYMYPDAESSHTLLWKTATRTLFIAVQFSMTLFSIAACLTYIIKNVSTNLENCLFTIMGFIVFCGLIYTMIVAFFIRHRVPIIFDKFSSIYDDRKYRSRSALDEAAYFNKCESFRFR